jgi:hypothetical protein
MDYDNPHYIMGRLVTCSTYIYIICDIFSNFPNHWIEFKAKFNPKPRYLMVKTWFNKNMVSGFRVKISQEHQSID